MGLRPRGASHSKSQPCQGKLFGPEAAKLAAPSRAAAFSVGQYSGKFARARYGPQRSATAREKMSGPVFSPSRGSSPMWDISQHGVEIRRTSASMFPWTAKTFPLFPDFEGVFAMTHVVQHGGRREAVHIRGEKIGSLRRAALFGLVMSLWSTKTSKQAFAAFRSWLAPTGTVGPMTAMVQSGQPSLIARVARGKFSR
jgi:hypothetical protein